MFGFKKQQPKNFIMLGPQGSGKGSNGKTVCKVYQVAYIATGDLLRAAREDQEFGEKIKECQIAGSLVPDEITLAILKKRLQESDCENGVLLDGFPRNLQQAKALDQIMNISAVIYMDADEKILIERCVTRRTCKKCKAITNLKYLNGKNACLVCGGEIYQRDDDTEPAIKKRLDDFDKQTAPLLAFYKTKTNEKGASVLISVNASKSIPEVDIEILEKLKAFFKK